MVKTKMWSEKAIIASEELLFDAESMSFSNKTNINEHLFGDIMVKLHSGKNTTLSDFLRKLNESIMYEEETDNFIKGKLYILLTFLISPTLRQLSMCFPTLLLKCG